MFFLLQPNMQALRQGPGSVGARYRNSRYEAGY